MSNQEGKGSKKKKDQEGFASFIPLSFAPFFYFSLWRLLNKGLRRDREFWESHLTTKKKKLKSSIRVKCSSASLPI